MYGLINNDKQFKQLAFQYYDNVSCVSLDEFELDLKMFNHTAQTIDKYVKDSTKIPERMLLNRIIIIHNMFGRFTVPGLFWKTDQKYWSVLKTYLNYLHYIPENSEWNDIPDDDNLTKILQTV